MMDRIHVPDWDMLSMYDQDVLLLLVFVVGEMLAVMEVVYHFHSVVSECQ